MSTLTSPWIEQLKKNRQVVSVNEDYKSHIAIVGAGIAGVCTAYFTLKNTEFDVVLVEAGQAAHGATGHNAGQIVSYFEQQFSGLVKEYGLQMAAEAQSEIDSAWQLIEQIYADTHITTPLAQFTGYAGCQDRAEVLVHLENIVYARQANLPIEPIILADDVEELEDIPEKYYGLYTRLPQEDVLSLLETEDTRYIAVLSARKGCMNSALFCEDLLDYMSREYSKRFVILEESPVREVILKKNSAMLSVLNKEIQADKVILCTNGFENFKITNTVGENIDKHFHRLVKGSVGYMAGYLEEHERSPIAISYLPQRSEVEQNAVDRDPYFYVTRRTIEGDDKTYSLICIGGPEALMDDTNNYKKEHPYPKEAQAMIDKFLHKTFKHAPQGKISYTYKWHGLMGYTPNGVRCIGPEPVNKVLLYNLGCNGIGILPSIYGGKKISQFLRGDRLKPSIFDPQESRRIKRKTHLIHPGLLKSIYLLFLSVVVLSSVLFAVKSTNTLKDIDPVSTIPYRTHLSGEYVCLPHANKKGPQTLECALGIKTDNDQYYAVDFYLMSQISPTIQVGERFSANGVVTPIERLSTDHWREYDIQGIFSVTDSVQKL